MARPRRKDTHLPPNVHYRHGAYYRVEKGKWIRLGNALAPALAVYAESFGKCSGDFPKLIDTVLPTIRRKNGNPLSPGSLRQYRSSARLLKQYFANDSVQDIRAKDMRQLKREMADRPIAFNSALKVLRHVFQYAIDTDLIDNDPTFNVEYYPVHARDRLITTEEWALIYAQAEPYLRNIMDLMFCTGQRVMDVVKIQFADLVIEGIRITQEKTEAKVTPAWTPDLRAVVERIKASPRHLKATTLLHTKRGRPFTYQRVNRMWLKASRAAAVPYTQLRDIRAMAATAVEEVGGIEQAQALLGHTTQRTTMIYLRNRKSRVVAGPEFKRKVK